VVIMRAPSHRDLLRLGRAAVAGVTALAHLVVVTGPAVADALDDAAARGQSFGRAVIPDVNAQVRLTDDAILKLFPGAADETDIRLEDLFPGYGAQPLVVDPRALFGDDAALRGAGAVAGGSLETSTTAQGAAWRSMMATRDRAGVDLSRDPMFDHTRDTLATLDRLTERFTDCDGVTEWRPRDIVTRRTIERSCTRVAAPTRVDRLRHDLQITTTTFDEALALPARASRIEMDFLVGRASVTSHWVETYLDCRPFGHDGDDRCETRTRIHDDTTILAIPMLDRDAFCGPDAVKTLTPTYANVAFPGVSRAAGAQTAPNCANGLTHRVELSGAACYDRWVNGAGDNDDERVTVCPSGSAALQYAVAEITVDAWTPQAAIDGLNALQRHGCAPALRTRSGSDGAAGSCVTLGGGRICPGDPVHALIDPPPFDPAEARVDRLALSVDADFSACVPVVSPVETCETLAANPACAYRATNPVVPPDGVNAAVFEDVYDCETSRTVASAGLAGALSCPDPIRGLGDDLITPIEESNASFHEVAARLAALQFTSMDTSCGDPTDPARKPDDCRVFEGEAMNCKVAAFGIVDCCDMPGGVSLAQYLQVAFAIGQLDSAIMALDEGAALRGAWELAAQPFHDSWAIVSENFASGVNSITGTTVFNTTEAGAKGIVALVQDRLLQKTAEWAGAVLGDAANSLFVLADPLATGPAFAGGVVQGPVAFAPEILLAYSVLSYVMLAYTIYNVALLVAQIIWSCSERELELGVKRELKSCSYRGQYCANRVFGFCVERRRGYCCFSSPLSRIMQEQIRPIVGMSWGSARRPQCGGFTIAELQRVDFNQIDLTEWMDILLDEGVMPDGPDATLEALTGSGRALADAMPPGMDRLDAVDRAVGRVGQVDTEDILQRAREGLIGDNAQ
jgi:conjugal transfer mating pair stabilization protein TraN